MSDMKNAHRPTRPSRKTERISIRLEADTHAALCRAAHADGIPVAAIVRRALRDAARGPRA